MKGVVWPLTVTMAIQALVSLVVYTPPVLAPVAQGDVGVPASAVGVVTSLIYFAATFTALSAGNHINRFGPMRASQLSLLLAASGIALIACAHPLLVALGALVVGTGYGVVTPSSSAILADRTPQNMRAFIFSLKQTGVPIGGALAGAAIPALIGVLGWKEAALIAGAACFLLAVAVQPYRAEVDLAPHAPRPAAPVHLLEPFRLVMSHARLRELAFASFSYSGMQMCMGSFLVVFLTERVGLTVATAGAALSVGMLAGTVGRVLWGIIADRWASPRTVLGMLGAGMAVAAFATAGMTAAWPYALLLVVSAIFGASAIGWNGVFLAEVVRNAPAGTAGSATGASLAMTYAGVVVLPTVFWAIVHFAGSYAAAFVAIGVFTLWRGSYFFRKAAIST
ncbi:MAG TPA: MFS transporter [Burkholderiales bacterium]|nr:MFS transporter [Burkholderiales bacterium]